MIHSHGDAYPTEAWYITHSQAAAQGDERYCSAMALGEWALTG
jgi:hypothetical protein